LDGLEIKHYTQLFAELIDSGKIKFSKEIKKKVTYHDPCYLGRKNNIYDEPRKILQSIPGVELVEMDKTKETAYCCGGGGTGLFYDLPKMNMNLARADQAKEKDVGCMAVACPICLQMLDDGIKSRDYKFEVNDIAQLVREAL
jgi:Fe-S oxidoreductase